MFINDFVWIAFWCLFFTRFPVVKGWGVNDVITLWAIAASGFGLAHMVMGNALMLPGIIMRGELDSWLLYPRAVLPHLLLRAAQAPGRCAVWYRRVFDFCETRPATLLPFHCPHFALSQFSSSATASLPVAWHFLWAALIPFQCSCAWRMITFSTYPSSIFQVSSKVTSCLLSFPRCSSVTCR